MQNSLKTKRLVGLASLVAIVVVLQVIAIYLPTIGGVKVNLALIPVVIGAILYGPIAGLILGIALSTVIMLDPGTAIFWSENIIATIFIILAKSIMAGVVPAFTFKLLNKKNFTFAVILSAILSPLVNTGIFTIGAFIWYQDIFGKTFYAIISVIWLNFIVELAINAVLSPTIMHIIRIVAKNYNVGSEIEIEDNEEDI